MSLALPTLQRAQTRKPGPMRAALFISSNAALPPFHWRRREGNFSSAQARHACTWHCAQPIPHSPQHQLPPARWGSRLLDVASQAFLWGPRPDRAPPQNSDLLALSVPARYFGTPLKLPRSPDTQESHSAGGVRGAPPRRHPHSSGAGRPWAFPAYEGAPHRTCPIASWPRIRRLSTPIRAPPQYVHRQNHLQIYTVAGYRDNR